MPSSAPRVPILTGRNRNEVFRGAISERSGHPPQFNSAIQFNWQQRHLDRRWRPTVASNKLPRAPANPHPDKSSGARKAFDFIRLRHDDASADASSGASAQKRAREKPGPKPPWEVEETNCGKASPTLRAQYPCGHAALQVGDLRSPLISQNNSLQNNWLELLSAI